MLPYDSGDYETALDRALAAVDYDGLARERDEKRRNGSDTLLGIGLSSYVEVCGVAPSKWIGLPGEGWGCRPLGKRECPSPSDR